ncbi:MAG: transglutaminase family protein, partial [Eubacteriales bacterium]
ASVPSFLYGCFLLLLCIGGTAGCLITGFSLPVYKNILICGTAVFSLLIPLLFRLFNRRGGWVFMIFAAVLTAVWIWVRIDALLNGFFYAGAFIFRYLCWGFKGLDMPESLFPYFNNIVNHPDDLETFSVQANMTEAFLLFILLLSLLFGYIYLMRRAVIFSALLPVPFFILCFLIISATMPALWALCMLLLYWLLLLFTRTTIRLHPRAAVSQAVILLIPALLLFFGVYSFYPRDTSVNELLKTAYNRTIDILSSAEHFFSGISVGFPDSSLFSVSAEGDVIAFDSLGSRNYLGRTVMKVKSDTKGVIYLRENTYNFYDEEGWSYNAPQEFVGAGEVNFTREDGSPQTVYLSEDLCTVSAVQNAAAVILRENGISASELTLSGARASLLFTPYYYEASSTETAYNGDRCVENPARSSDYSVTYYRFPGVFSALTAQNEAVSEQQALLRVYGAQTKKLYTQIEPELAADLRAHLSENGIRISDDNLWETVTAVTEYVRSTAVYSLQAGTAPDNKDFVLWFLEDAETGYCTHFATAEVMLLRACGIPARLAAGFLVNITSTNRYTAVRDSNAHAWAEVFDERLGWIPIEATPAGNGENNSTSHDNPIFGNPEMPAETTDSVTAETTVTKPDESTAVSYETENGQTTDHPSSVSDPDETAVTDTGLPMETDQNGNTGGPGIGNGSGSNASAAAADIVKILCMVIGICLIPALLLTGMIRYRQKRLTQLSEYPGTDDRNTAALTLYHRCYSIASELHKTLPPEIDRLAEKARFSPHTLTKDEYEQFRNCYFNLTAALRAHDTFFSAAHFRHYWINVYW